jgi:hypothetical protein
LLRKPLDFGVLPEYLKYILYLTYNIQEPFPKLNNNFYF